MAEAVATVRPFHEWAPPQDFDEYRLVRPLGSGSGGRVYLAHDTLLDRPVAVKFMPAPDARSLSRFLVEARACARIQHPNVATLYRVGQFGDRAYLVSEYVAGTSLERLSTPIDWKLALDLALGLSRALAAVHRRGVLHRDIKPANAIQALDGEVKLVDFGLARLLESATGHAAPLPGDARDPALVGTPYFMAPEAWLGEELTHRSEIYSLGAVLFGLCAPPGLNRDLNPAELADLVPRREPPPLSSKASHVDARFAAVVDRCLKRDPAQRFDSADELIDALETLRASMHRLAVPLGNPYRGLQPFSVEHRALFFGRRRDERAILERLCAEPLLLVAGESGVGKSSLCLAGVLPAVEQGALGRDRLWRPLRLVPGRAPLTALVAQLAPLLDTTDEALLQRIRADPEEVARALRVKLGTRDGLLLYVDQLEEVIALGAPQQRAPFSEALAALAAGFEGLRVLATVRSDFITRIAELPALGELVPRALHLLRGLTADDAREAIVGPARVKGVRFESTDLIGSLVVSASMPGGSLPLLQFALAELWDAREEGVITASSLNRIGGVAGALARHADSAIARLSPAQRDVARRLLLRLVTPERTRARRNGDELTRNESAAEGVLENLVRARLVVAGDGGAFEMAHEALLTGWGTLARWIDEDASGRALRERVETGALEWERAGRASEALWGETRLAEVAALDSGILPPLDMTFLQASRKAVRNRRLVQRALAAGFVLALLFVYAGVKLQTRRDTERKLYGHLGEARQLLERARETAGEEHKIRDLAFALFDGKHRQEAEAAWTQALTRSAAAERVYAAASAAFEKALALGHDRAEVAAPFADFLVERTVRAEAENNATLRAELLGRLALYDRGGDRGRAFHAPAELSIRSRTPGVQATLLRVDEREGRRTLALPRELGALPISSEQVEPGSWQLHLRAPGHEAVIAPLLLRRGERRSAEIDLPRLGSLPRGFAFIPAGRTFFGTAAGESVRQFFNTAPLHEVAVGAFLIARHETTYGDWIAWLRALPPAERAQRTPHVGAEGLSGQLELREVNGRFRLKLQPGSQPLEAVEGEKVRYPAREQRREQDWLRLPVAGVSLYDARAYAAWLNASGRVPGARLCSELEWERAARGADARSYPHGDVLEAGEANFDQTYGRRPDRFGPDEVGSHPASRSPFGVDDLSGNVWEWTESSLGDAEGVARGGSYWSGSTTSQAVNRELPGPTFRSLIVGVRVCADFEGTSRFPSSGEAR